MAPIYTKKLGLWIEKTNNKAQKIDEFALKTYEIVIASFQVYDRLEKARFFQKTFLVADTNIKIIFGILFFIFSKVKVDFTLKKLF